jgi:C-terminal processing protease CtpA/Prc
MKQTISLLLLFLSFNAFSQTRQQVDNEYAFAKVYGYLKYFYPGDEAEKIDWDKFAIYGAQKIENCKNEAELKKTLNSLIGEIMPGVKILDQSEHYKFDASLLTPKNLKGYNVVSWQHLGVGLTKAQPALYKSARTNRPQIFKPVFNGFASASSNYSDESMAGKSFELTARAKVPDGKGEGRLWFRIDSNTKMLFLDNMHDRPIKSNEWATYTIRGKINEGAKTVSFGALSIGLGSFLVDDISLKIDGKGVFNTSFETEKLGKEPLSMKTVSPNATNDSGKFSFLVKGNNSSKYLEINSPINAGRIQIINQKPFEKQANFGEYIEKAIGSNLKLVAPLALYGNKSTTYPNVDSLKASILLSEINNSNYTLTASNLHFRLGNLINAWNVFQHFYPYFDIAKTDWNEDLRMALKESYEAKDGAGYASLLKRLTSKLKDGHIYVSNPENKNFYFPPLAWTWAGKDLVVTSSTDKTLELKKGDVVKKINGEDVSLYFKRVNEHISSATEGYLKHRSETESITGEKNTPFDLFLEGDKMIKMSRNVYAADYYPSLPKTDTIKSLGNDITYIHIGNAKMKMINEALPLLQKSRAIICDLRGYPTDNTEFIQYLITKKDTSSQWMQVSKFIYPDQENQIGYENYKWGLTPKSPHLDAKIFFLIDGQAVSYAESYMSFIEHYKLATIIGQPTAGTNGNVNTITLPGGYNIRFTGMKVSKHDGSQHHGIGIIPNIYVERTAKGIKEGRDEILERAIAEALK